MPIVEITLAEGRSPEMVRTLITALTNAVCESIAAPKANVRVVVREVPTTHWAAGDVTLAERAAQSPAPPQSAAKPSGTPLPEGAQP
jgi:4-oxalocrotonate tautomerase